MAIMTSRTNKAKKIILEGRVYLLKDDTAAVVGDQGVTYFVKSLSTTPHETDYELCTCPDRALCKHWYAAKYEYDKAA
jgi:uncharacterized Zn finger protein